MLGFPEHVVTALTGHTDVKGLKPYLQGVDKMKQSEPLQEALQARYSEVFTQSLEGANTRSYSGVTGRAARNAGVTGQSRRRKSAPNEAQTAAKQLPNAKPGAA